MDVQEQAPRQFASMGHAMLSTDHEQNTHVNMNFRYQDAIVGTHSQIPASLKVHVVQERIDRSLSFRVVEYSSLEMMRL